MLTQYVNSPLAGVEGASRGAGNEGEPGGRGGGPGEPGGRPHCRLLSPGLPPLHGWHQKVHLLQTSRSKTGNIILKEQVQKRRKSMVFCHNSCGGFLDVIKSHF